MYSACCRPSCGNCAPTFPSTSFSSLSSKPVQESRIITTMIINVLINSSSKSPPRRLMQVLGPLYVQPSRQKPDFLSASILVVFLYNCNRVEVVNVFFRYTICSALCSAANLSPIYFLLFTSNRFCFTLRIRTLPLRSPRCRYRCCRAPHQLPRCHAARRVWTAAAQPPVLRICAWPGNNLSPVILSCHVTLHLCLARR
jgi:hypothetical protein